MIPYIENWKSNLTSFSGTGDVNFSSWLNPEVSAFVIDVCLSSNKRHPAAMSAFHRLMSDILRLADIPADHQKDRF
jgi:hypothetical protein